ncbi:protein disulfide-isomerase domain [Aphanomyces invadans]|nr:protein disulfide-isomerase domain [Aphanomyces invadans]ETW06795.1 protein disulfide-isomerase domain [Aphanomyces invadans]|eukprot:XP_008864870.1 protein disulfide-isomerase domain [Aphanomyces invadans]
MTSMGLRVIMLALCSAVAFSSAFYTSASAVKNLDPKSFEKEVIGGKGVWFVEFYAPWCGHCKNLAPEWKKAAKALDGIVNVAAVDCDQHKELAGKYGVQGFPTIKVFGDNKRSPTDYQGQRTAQAIVDAAVKEASKLAKARMSGKASTGKPSPQEKPKPKSKPSPSSSAVVTLTDDNFDELVLNSGDVWMVEFYAPWCGHCKSLAPEWEQAASELKGQVKLGALDATAAERKASEYGIKGFPTIKLFGPTASSASDAQDYQGPRQASGIVSYALHQLEKLGGGLKVPEITSMSTMQDHCAGKSICVVAVLPHIFDSGAKGRTDYLSQVEGAAKLVRGKPFRFSWVQGGDQNKLEQAFDLTFGYPAVVAISLDKQRYSVMRAAFDSKSIATFLEDIFSGKQSTYPYDNLPAIHTVTPWDGKDAKVDAIVDDDDDDILKELGLGGGSDEL